MKLYLARHGETVSPDVDPELPLSQNGILETKKVSIFLQHIAVDEIIHSTKKRAKQTAEIYGNALATKPTIVQREGLKPMDDILPFVDEINACENPLMIVGHLPFMEKLLSYLLYEDEGRCPVTFCGSCVVCVEKQNWTWKIIGVISPNLLP